MQLPGYASTVAPRLLSAQRAGSGACAAFNHQGNLLRFLVVVENEMFEILKISKMKNRKIEIITNSKVTCGRDEARSRHLPRLDAVQQLCGELQRGHRLTQPAHPFAELCINVVRALLKQVTALMSDARIAVISKTSCFVFHKWLFEPPCGCHCPQEEFFVQLSHSSAVRGFHVLPPLWGISLRYSATTTI